MVCERPTDTSKEFEEDEESIRCIDIVFEVAKCFYKVPRQWFEDSPLFREIFELPVAMNAMADGSSTEKPLRLYGINETDFKQLLGLMASSYGREESLSVHDWLSVLKLSVMWDFQAIKEKAIKRVFRDKALDPLTKISLARDYGLPQELLHSLSLFTRQHLIKMKDTEVLGLDYVVKILEIQERIDPTSVVFTCSRCAKTHRDHFPSDPTLRQNYDFTEPLNQIFREEVKLLESGLEKDTITVEPVDRKIDDKFIADVFFLVENCLFKGSRLSFRKSPIFQDMFDLPIVENAVPEGLSKDHPIHLEGIRKTDFKQLLRFMNTSFGKEETFSPQEWASILKLSAMWEFREIRKISIDRAFNLPMDVVEKVVMARDYRVVKWFIPSLNEYARLDRPISVADVDRLGLTYLLKIAEARQTGLKQLSHFVDKIGCPSCANYGYKKDLYSQIRFMWQTDCTGALRSVFQDEIESVNKTWSVHLAPTNPPVYLTSGIREHKSSMKKKEEKNRKNRRYQK